MVRGCLECSAEAPEVATHRSRWESPGHLEPRKSNESGPYLPFLVHLLPPLGSLPGLLPGRCGLSAHSHCGTRVSFLSWKLCPPCPAQGSPLDVGGVMELPGQATGPDGAPPRHGLSKAPSLGPADSAWGGGGAQAFREGKSYVICPHPWLSQRQERVPSAVFRLQPPGPASAVGSLPRGLQRGSHGRRRTRRAVTVCRAGEEGRGLLCQPEQAVGAP